MAYFSSFRTAALVWLLFVVAAVPSFAAIWYVTPTGTGSGSTSWANASNDLQDVITNKAVSGDQIWVAQGIYTPTYDGNGVQFPAGDPRTRCFLLKDGVAVYGGFNGGGSESLLTDRNFRANLTILSGDFENTPLNTADDAYHVVMSVNDGTGAILDGFIIEKGNSSGSSFPLIEGVITAENAGGGLYAPTGTPTIQNCIFQQNLSGGFGAGMGTGGSPMVQGCFFLNNTAAGHGGGFGSVESSPQLINCVFAGNSCGVNGGGIYMNSRTATPIVQNCTVYGNAASQYGGGFFNQNGPGTLVNTIIWGNTALNFAQVYNEDGGFGGIITASYNLIAGGYPGIANIDVNPYFKNTVDLNGTDNQYFTYDDGLKIGDCSPARGAATTGPVDDITGVNRALGDAIGAYANSNAASAPSGGGFFSTSPVCPAAGTSLNLSYSGGIDPVTMVYTDGITNYTINNYISGATITPPAPTVTTTYSLLSLTDGEGCADGSPSLNFTEVTVYAPITVSNISVNKPTICDGGDATITLTITGGTSPYNLIYTANGMNALTIDPFFSGDGLFTVPTTTTEFEVTFLKDANECNAGITAGAVTQTVTVLNGVGSHIYVKANATGAGTGYSWDDAFTSLQAAFDFAASCTGLSEIWVAAGTYLPSQEPDGTKDSPRDFAFVIPDGVSLYGGFPNLGNPTMDHRYPAANVTRLGGDFSADDSYNPSGSLAISGQTENAHHVVIAVNHATPSVIDGFTIQGGNADGTGSISAGAALVPRNTGGGLYIDNAAVSPKNTVFIANKAAQGGGVYQTNTFNLYENCFFYRNKATGGGGGLLVAGGTNFTVQNAAFWGNDAVEGGGAYVSGGSAPGFEHCTFSYNAASAAGGGLYALNASPNVQNSIFWDNSGSLTSDLSHSGTGAIAVANSTVQPGSSYAVSTNTDSDPLFAAIMSPSGADTYFMTDDDGIRLKCGSPAINAGGATVLTRDIAGNNHLDSPDMGAYEFVPADTRTQLYVDVNVSNGGAGDGSSWADAFPSLANALQSVGSCNPNVSEIWVADGTYYPAYQIDGTTADPLLFSFSIPYGVSVYGGFSGNEQSLSGRNYNLNLTILSGDVNTDGTMAGNAYHVVHQPIVETYATIDGVTIQDGNAAGTGIDANGGGILLEDGAELTVSNCIVDGNEASGNGGGIYATYSNLIVKNSEVSNNTAQNGGGIATNGGNANIINANIILNIANVDGGAIYLAGGAPNIFNTVLYDNAAFNSGAGIYTLSSSASIINCTFSGNDAFTDGGGIHDNGGGSTIANSIFWGNTPASNEIAGSAGNTTTVSYAIVQSATPYAGSNNTINTDPLFEDALDPAGLDGRWRTSDDGLRLSCASPALNAGNNVLLPDDTYDLNGNFDPEESLPIDITGAQRAQGAAVNMGAYEVVDLTGASTTRLYVNDNAPGANNGTSWNDAFTSLQAALDALSCSPATQVWVAGGTYKPTKDLAGNIAGNPSATFKLPAGIAIYGGFIGTEASTTQRTTATIANNPSILNGDIGVNVDAVAGTGASLTITNNFDNVYHVVVANDLTVPTTLNGFTITGGNATSNVDFLGIVDGNASGGGLFVMGSGTNLTLENLTFTGNAANNYGGGMFAINFASPAITNCVFDRNMANNGGGLLNGTNSSPAITNCTFSNNNAGAGGGLKNVDSSSPAISGCTFSGNYATFAGGMDNTTGATPTITDGKFLNNSAGISGGAVYNNGTSPTFKRTVFANNTAIGNDGGAMVNEAGSPLVEACVFAGNTANFSSGAIFQYNVADVSIVNCTFFGNTATGLIATGAAIMADAGSSFSAQNAIFRNNTTPNNFADDVSGEALVAQNTVQLSSLQYSLLQEAVTSPNISDDGGNQVANPLFGNDADPDGADNTWATTDDGLMLTACSPAIDAANGGPGTDILNVAYYDNPIVSGASAGDMGAYEATATNALNRLYVDGGLGSGANNGSSWANAFRGATALQNAIDAACTETEIWVKAGTYKPSKDPLGGTTALNRDNTFFINKKISLYGGFAGTETSLSQRSAATIHANPAVLSGDLLGGDTGFSGNGENAHHVVMTATGNPITIDGFTIRGGNANGGGSVVVDANPAIAQNQGGGIHVHYSSPIIKNCIFTYNYAMGGGGGYANNSYVNLADCTFDTNTGGSQGGGLFTIAGQPIITNGIFVGNVGGSEGGGMYCANSGPTISNTVFTNNSTPGNGGGLYSLGNIPIIGNTTFYLNSAQKGGGLYNDNAIPQLTNVILWGNTATNGSANEKQALAFGISGGGNIANSVIQDGVPALMTDDGNNSAADPNFANPATPFAANQLWRTSSDGLIPAGCGLQFGTAVGGFDITGSARSGPSTPGAYTASGVMSAVVGIQPSTNTLVALNNTARTNYRYASAVNAFSSEAGGTWAAAGVLGSPTVYPASDFNGAGQWRAAIADNQIEYLDLSFASAAPIDFVDIYETWEPGAVSLVEVYNPGTLAFEPVYTASASPAGGSGQSRLLHIPFTQTLFNVDRVKLTLNSPKVADYQYIDAVAIGQTDLGYTYAWTPAAVTSSIVPTTSGNYAVNIISGGCAGNADEGYTFGEIEVQGNGFITLDGSIMTSMSAGTEFMAGQTSQEFKIINNGGAMLTIASIGLSGPAMFTTSGLSSSSLLPGDTATFALNFVPTASGIFNAIVTINSDDADEAAYDFAVSATAIDAEALAFDGVNDYITAPANAGYETGELTVEMWIKPDFTIMPVGNPMLVGNRDAANTRWSYHIRNDLSGVDFWNGSSMASWNYTFTNNQWYHIAFSTGPAITEAYVNGVSIGTQLATFGASTGLPLLIGGNPNAPTEWFPGAIDEVRIWGDVICRNQITAYPNCEVSTSSPYLVTYFRLNQGVSNGLNTAINTADDLSATNQDGTLTNFALTGAASNWVSPGGIVAGTSCDANLLADIQVSGNATDINSGDNTPSPTDHTEFAFGPGTRTFKLNNLGPSDLEIYYVSISGANADKFSHNGGAATIAGGGSRDVTVTYAPGGSTGVHTAQVQIASTDCDEPLYTFDITATSGNVRRYVNDNPLGTGYNGTSWTDAYDEVQVAIDACNPGDTLWIAAGIYNPTKDPFGNSSPALPRDKTFYFPENIVVLGGFAGTETSLTQRTTATIAVNETVLSGDFDGDDSGFTNNGENAYHVITTLASPTLDGLTIQRGNADNGSDLAITGTVSVSRNKGGGMVVYNGNPVVNNCIFRSNNSSGAGAGGGMYAELGNPTITECLFEGNNSLQGGGLRLAATNAMVDRTIFSGNTASFGGGLHTTSGAPQIRNSVFWNNSAITSGGGISSALGSASCYNISVVQNSAPDGGGIIEYLGDNLNLNTVLIWGNTATNGTPDQKQVYVVSGGPAGQIVASLIQDGVPAGLTDVGQNLAADPVLIDIADGDGGDGAWRTPDDGLIPTNCSVDLGTSTGGSDIRGVVRSGPSMRGAYERIGVLSGVVGIQPDNTLVALVNDASTNYRYANLVNDFSTEYNPSPGSNSAAKALGAPDLYPIFGDNWNAWAGTSPGAASEFIDLNFPNTAPIDFVDVYETYSPGAISTIEVYNPGTTAFETVYTATPSPAPLFARVLHVKFPSPTAFSVDRIRITLSPQAVGGWAEIDAVAIGQENLGYGYGWNTTAGTATIVPTACATYSVDITINGCTDNASTPFEFHDLTIRGNVTVIPDGDTSPDAGDHTDFGAGVPQRTFTVANTGGSVVTVSTIDFTGANAGFFSASGATLPVDLIPGTSITFDVDYVPGGATGTHTATVQVHSNDCDEAVYDFAISAMSGPALYYVNDNASGANNGTSWTDAFTSLQSALTAASAGDSIWVATGMYKPSQEPDGTTDSPREFAFMLPPGVLLYGGFAGNEALLTGRTLATIIANPTILSGDFLGNDVGLADNTENAYHVLVSIAATVGTRIDGFIIEGGNANYPAGSQTISTVSVNHGQGGALWVNAAAGLELQSCIFQNNFGEDGGAIFSGDAVMNVRQTIFTGNSAATGAGMSVYGPATNLIENCVFTGNTTSNVGSSLSLFFAATSSVVNSTFTQNAGPGTLVFDTNGPPTITNCVLYGNSNGGADDINPPSLATVSYTLTGVGLHAGTDNLLTNPYFVNAADPDGADNKWFTADDGLQLVCGSPAVNVGTGTGKDITGAALNGTKDMGAYERQAFAVAPTMLYVNHATPSLQSGLAWGEALTDLSSALACVQTEPTVIEIWVAQGTYTPTRDGNGFPTASRTRCFILKDGVALYGGFSGTGIETARSQRDFRANLTILSGDFEGTGNTADDAIHVVVSVADGASTILDGFVIEKGNADGGGNQTIEGGFISNTEGGGMNIPSGSPTIQHCVFQYNISGSQGGGMNTDSNPIVRDCFFLYNTAVADAGGFRSTNSSSPQLINCVFVGNSCGINGGAIYCDSGGGGSPLVQNCTIYGNSAGGSGGGFCNQFGTSTLTNTLIWGNTQGSGGQASGVVASATYNLVQGGISGTGNIDADPLFVNTSNLAGIDGQWATSDDGLRLLCGSPAIHAGTNTGTPPLDILAAAANGIKDMGAYEYQGFMVPPTLLYVNQSATGTQAGDTWGNAFKELTTALACEAITASVTEIWVATGTYKPTTGTDRSATFALKSGLALYGGFPASGNPVVADPAVYPTMLSGEIGSAGGFDNCYHVVTASGVDQSAVLNGFVLQAGNADGSPNGGKGGGLLVDGAYPLIEQCQIQSNDATYGAGVAILNPGTNAAQITELNSCTITNNTATNSGGGIYAEQMMVKFTGTTTISANLHGGAVCE